MKREKFCFHLAQYHFPCDVTALRGKGLRSWVHAGQGFWNRRGL
jgi:hypothetical protein